MRNFKLILIIGSLTIFAALPLYPQQIINVRITTDTSSDQSETAVAVHPFNSDTLAADWNDHSSPQHPTRLGVGFSTDGGTSWAISTLPPHDRIVDEVDPSVAIDRNRNAYFCYMGYTSDSFPSRNMIYVSKTKDFNSSPNWIHHQRVSSDTLGLDMPALAIDNTTGIYSGRIYVTWRHDSRGMAAVHFAYLTNQGETVSADSILAYDSTIGNIWSRPVVNPNNGDVYVVWAKNPNSGFNTSYYKIRKSTNGGVNFDTAYTGPSFTGRTIQTGSDRINEIPNLAIDFNTGILHLVFANQVSQTDTRFELNISSSNNSGHSGSWSTPPTVIGAFGWGNDFFPAITIDPLSRITVTYYHSNDSDPNQLYHCLTYKTISCDGGNTFTAPTRVSKDSSNMQAHTNAQDYLEITSSTGMAFPVWTGYDSIDHYYGNIYIKQDTFFQQSKSSFATAYGSTPKSSFINSIWNVIYANNGDLYHDSSTNNGASWDSVKISGSVGGVTATSGASLYQALNGKLYVIFNSNGNGIYYNTKNPGHAWGTPRRIRASSGVSYPSLTVDQNCVGHVVFISSGTMLAPVNYVYYGTFNTGSDTLTIQKLLYSGASSNNTGTSLTQLRNGQLHAVWGMNGEIYYSYGTGSNWSTAINISNNSGASEYPSIASAPDTPYYNLRVAWQDNTPGNYDVFYRQNANGRWYDVVNLTANAGDSKYPQVKYSGFTTGCFVYTWSDNTGNSDPNNYDVWYTVEGGTNTRLTSSPQPSMFPCITDTSSSTGSRFLVAWTEGLGLSYSIASTTTEMSFSKRSAPFTKAQKVPNASALLANYPNPFNPTTTVKYKLAEPGIVTLTIFNILGQEVTQLVRAERDAGDYATTWNAADVPSGIYFVRMTVTDQFGKQQYQGSKKILLVKQP